MAHLISLLNTIKTKTERWAKIFCIFASSLAFITFCLTIGILKGHAYASGEQAVVGMPFPGKWAWNTTNVTPPYTDSNTSYPAVHAIYYGDWGTDLYPTSGQGTAVKLHVTATSGTVTFTKRQTNDTCSSYGANIAGKGIVLNVLINGVVVGSIDYEHLDNISNGPYTNGMTIGTVTSESLHSSCYSVRHIHIEMRNESKYSCWVDKGVPGTTVADSDAIGVLGSTNTGAQQACSSTPNPTPSPPPPPPPAPQQEGSSVGGDFNGDGYGDMTIFYKRDDGGADVKIAYGDGTAPLSNVEHRVGLVGGGLWDWTRMKIVAGEFNGDNYSDIAILYKRNDGGADVKIIHGNIAPYTFTSVVHLNSLPAIDGWRWDDMKIVAGNFNGDAWDDISIIHKRNDGGADVKIAYGDGTAPLSNVEHRVGLVGNGLWDWSKMIVTAGKYNNDIYSDIAILHKRNDGGADVKIIYGNIAPHTLINVVHLSSLPGPPWDYDDMKIVSGRFNNDTYADVAIIHKHAYDNGADVKVIYGDGTAPLANVEHRSTLPAIDGWRWDDMKLTSGDYNKDTWDDVGMLHRHSYDNGADIKTVYGNVSPHHLLNNAQLQTLSAPLWDWTRLKAF